MAPMRRWQSNTSHQNKTPKKTPPSFTWTYHCTECNDIWLNFCVWHPGWYNLDGWKTSGKKLPMHSFEQESHELEKCQKSDQKFGEHQISQSNRYFFLNVMQTKNIFLPFCMNSHTSIEKTQNFRDRTWKAGSLNRNFFDGPFVPRFREKK